jgi:TIR domain
VSYIQLFSLPRIDVSYTAAGDAGVSKSFRLMGDEISEATQRVMANIWPMCEQLAWDHLRGRLGAKTVMPADSRKTVLISYRKGDVERQEFVEALAHRLGQEGFRPWYDEWEIKAGDSLPREIGSGLADAYAVIVVLTSDYPGGRWAREEFEAAITKRIEQGTRVIPVLHEPCDRPSLLSSLSYIDCTDHRAQPFEKQFLKLIDALNEIELNPYA